MADPTISAVRIPSSTWPLDFARDAWAYPIDAWQRGILFLDALANSQKFEASPRKQLSAGRRQKEMKACLDCCDPKICR
ncbi:hypothetical protein SAMN04488557_1860 [Hyphomicrobium facile]|uniref:Uncharacterized protein n=1 Tax=Hyphomicrobium facile TaxID=51670 RepID=A0A1I7NET6_9HYPH|nr:hypothetical protein SAMN04488557_1860 [Hyphomicrobium facile]